MFEEPELPSHRRDCETVTEEKLDGRHIDVADECISFLTHLRATDSIPSRALMHNGRLRSTRKKSGLSSGNLVYKNCQIRNL